MNKARVIEACGYYSAIDDAGAEDSLKQVHLAGFDTLLRVLNTKYYPLITP